MLGALGVSTGISEENLQEDNENKGGHEDMRYLHSPNVSVSVLEPRSSKDTAVSSAMKLGNGQDLHDVTDGRCLTDSTLPLGIQLEITITGGYSVLLSEDRKTSDTPKDCMQLASDLKRCLVTHELCRILPYDVSSELPLASSRLT